MIDISRDKKYKEKVYAKDIHGKYPYKLYLELKGNTVLGKYIVVIDEKPISKNDELVSEINIHRQQKFANNKYRDEQISRPAIASDDAIIHYNVKEVTILEVSDTPIFVFRKKEIKKW